jgi:hypothetical protein
MDGQTIFMALFGLILVGYIVLYVGGRRYLQESFQSGGEAGAGSATAGERWPAPLPVAPPMEGQDDAKPGRVLMEHVTMDPVAKGNIQSLDDYEYNLVYQNESDREISQDLKNKLMSQRPFDWSGLPSSSAQFQAGMRESFENATPTVPDNAQPFRAINGDSMVPPDVDSVEMEERKLLQTYKPPTPEELASYSLETESPEKLIAKLYEKKGLVPTVAHKDGTNVYEIIGVRRKDEKIMYEDEEAPASAGPMQAAGEGRISVPAAAYDTAAARDPFYDMNNGGKARIGKWDYQAWTPGLERMFAPSNETQSWY